MDWIQLHSKFHSWLGFTTCLISPTCPLDYYAMLCYAILFSSSFLYTHCLHFFFFSTAIPTHPFHAIPSLPLSFLSSEARERSTQCVDCCMIMSQKYSHGKLSRRPLISLSDLPSTEHGNRRLRYRRWHDNSSVNTYNINRSGRPVCFFVVSRNQQ